MTAVDTIGGSIQIKLIPLGYMPIRDDQYMVDVRLVVVNSFLNKKPVNCGDYGHFVEKSRMQLNPRFVAFISELLESSEAALEAAREMIYECIFDFLNEDKEKWLECDYTINLDEHMTRHKDHLKLIYSKPLNLN